MSTNAEEAPGPSVDSKKREERILARQDRINKRNKNTKNEGNTVSQVKDESTADKDSGKSSKQINMSSQRIEKLRYDGTELVTNVGVAAMAREDARKVEEEKTNKERREKLEAEGVQDLLMMTNQRELINSMIAEKEKIIQAFQLELKAKDDQYVKDLKKQAEDIDLIIERMNAQVKNLQKAYREELTKIDQAFESERLELLENQRGEWEGLMAQRSNKEVENLKESEQRVDDFAAQLQHLRVQDAEEYNMVKIKLETDVQVLEQQLQAMRATYQLNSEKLDYNFQVLKKRDEENTITKSQQKRKITRLQDTLNNLKSKFAKQEAHYRDENQQLADVYKRITDQFKELQKKSKHFQATDTKKFIDVWVMNEEEAMDLAKKVMDEDSIVHCQQLGLEWSVPETAKVLEGEGRPLLAGEPPKQASTSSLKSARAAVDDIMRAASEAGSGQLEFSRSTMGGEGKGHKYSPVLIKLVLELLCAEADFLVEKKLVHLLAPLEHDERLLMKLDSIFKAIGVETEDDINRLTEYFLATVEDNPEQANLIHPNEVLKAIRLFVADSVSPNKVSTHKPAVEFDSTAPARDSGNDAGYWQALANILPNSHELKWDALLEGLQKYHGVLAQRAKLIEDTDKLQNQNSELRMLLQQYIGSRETDVQVLEQQLQAMRATYQLNSEKLDYNFQVLKKRDEENTITKSQQKRKITRLQDTLNNLKSKFAKQEAHYRDENQQLADVYKRITDQFKELQKKSKHFQATDTKKFIDVWVMNEEEAMDLAKKVMDEDSIVHCQQLGLEWSVPETAKVLEGEGRPLLAGEPPKQASTSSLKSARAAVDDIMRAASEAGSGQLEFSRSTMGGEGKGHKYSPVLIKLVLELLCAEADFLVEKKLVHLLAPLEHDERLLMKLDSIFKAIGVETEDDINRLTEYFLATVEDNPEQANLIHPNEVLKAIRLFVADSVSPNKVSTHKPAVEFDSTAPARDSGNDAGYWQALANILPNSHELKWDALLEGLQKYHGVLAQRAKLIEDTDKLQNQNSELRMLLQQYIGSRVNQDLQIPPTHTIPSEVLRDYAIDS
eukprot:sb/3461464/